MFHWCVWIPRDPVERKQASSVTAPMYIGYQLVHSMVGCVQCMAEAGEGLQSRPRLTLRFHVLCSAVFLSVIVVALVVFLVVLILVKPLQASLASYTLTVGLALLPSVLVWLATRLWGMFLARDLRLVYPVMFTHCTFACGEGWLTTGDVVDVRVSDDAIAMINNMIIGLFVVLKRVLILFGYITVRCDRL